MSFLDKLVGDTTEKVQATGNSLNQLAEMFKDIKMQRTWKQFNQLDDKSPEAIRTFQKQHGLGFDQMAALINGEVEYKQFENLLNQSEWAKKNQGMSESLDAAKLKGMGLDNQTKQAALDYFNKNGVMPGGERGKTYRPSKGELNAAKNMFYKTQGWQATDEGYARQDREGNLVPVTPQEMADADITFQTTLQETLSNLGPNSNFLGALSENYRDTLASMNDNNSQRKPENSNFLGKLFDAIRNDNTDPKKKRMRADFQDQMASNFKSGQKGVLAPLINKLSGMRRNSNPGGA